MWKHRQVVHSLRAIVYYSDFCLRTKYTEPSGGHSHLDALQSVYSLCCWFHLSSVEKSNLKQLWSHKTSRKGNMNTFPLSNILYLLAHILFLIFNQNMPLYNLKSIFCALHCMMIENRPDWLGMTLVYLKSAIFSVFSWILFSSLYLSLKELVSERSLPEWFYS